MIKIIGTKGRIKNIDYFLKWIDIFSKENDTIIQVFDANMIFDKAHLISSFEHAKRAMERGTNTTNSLEKEIMLYASGERQIKLAINKMGIKENISNYVIIFINQNFRDKINSFDILIDKISNEFSFIRDDNVLSGDYNNLIKFGISQNEKKTVSKSKYNHLVLEKVAMVDIIK
jgi:tRNA threonylcarbamoyladenosine modification (KEOPS) complex Cgi121 subunit